MKWSESAFASDEMADAEAARGVEDGSTASSDVESVNEDPTWAAATSLDFKMQANTIDSPFKHTRSRTNADVKV